MEPKEKEEDIGVERRLRGGSSILLAEGLVLDAARHTVGEGGGGSLTS